ncbi:Glioblastoma-amplified sequence [Intoshia linei]|uniref:Glioblastoma-amplified sequence n=1 Tax=Intoshia linei TaxID=1819745 RepID=A0A177B570_9BILA|nr:Glioblastoma-amplified sequence [Intoshia linei]
MVTVVKLNTGNEPHSTLFSEKKTVFELKIHRIKPEVMSTYLSEEQEFVKLMREKISHVELIGSWTVDIGDQDEVLSLWRYKGGYPALDASKEIYRTDKDFLDFRRNRNKMLRFRRNEILLGFNFWPKLTQRTGCNIYDIRSYFLKPGTIAEWGANWQKGIQFRQYEDEPVHGFFTNIGDMFQVHHIFAYKDLDSRNEARAHAWQHPGWVDCVSYTVPLIKSAKCRICVPTPFSTILV